MKTTVKLGGARTRVGMMALVLGGVTLAACGDDAETGSGGAGGAGTTGAQASTGTSTSTSTSTSTTSGSPASTSAGPGGGEGGAGDGGAGDGGAAEGGAGGEGSGGAPGACFDADDFADLFTLEADDLCVVARYDAAGWATTSYGVQPTWGTHGGLLTGEYVFDEKSGVIAGVSLTRWTAPVGVGGDLASSVEGVTLELDETADFGGSQFFDFAPGVTGFTYSGSDFINEGGLVLFDDLGVLENDLLIGGFGLGLDLGPEGFALHTALGALFETADAAGLYGVVPCDGDFMYCVGFTYSQWGDATGPLAVDTDGNVFAVMTSFDGTQTARGFSSTEIEIAQETDGVDFFTVDGFGTPLAALAPDDGADGLLVYQATNAEFAQEAPIFVPFTTADGAIVTTDEAQPLLTLAAIGTPVSLVADDEGRIWVGVGTEDGTTFAVLARP